jgi:hypothetical protein
MGSENISRTKYPPSIGSIWEFQVFGYYLLLQTPKGPISTKFKLLSVGDMGRDPKTRRNTVNTTSDTQNLQKLYMESIITTRTFTNQKEYNSYLD